MEFRLPGNLNIQSFSWGGWFCISLMRSFSRINPDSHYCGSCFAKASWRRADSCKWAVFHRSFCIHRCYICLIVGRILNILQYSYGNRKLAWLTFILLIYLSFYILIVLTCWWKPVSVISRAHVNIAGRITHFQNLGQWSIYLSNIQIHNYSSKADGFLFVLCFVKSYTNMHWMRNENIKSTIKCKFTVIQWSQYLQEGSKQWNLQSWRCLYLCSLAGLSLLCNFFINVGCKLYDIVRVADL